MGEIKKGIVLSIEDDHARCAPIDNIDLVSTIIQIAGYIETGTIKKGDKVVFCTFSDNTGIILSKM